MNKLTLNNMKKIRLHRRIAGLISLLVLSQAPLPALHAVGATTSQEIDRETLDKWSAPYRGWHYQPGHVIPAQPNIPDHRQSGHGKNDTITK